MALAGFTLTIASSDAACSAATSRMVTIEPTGTDRIFELDASALTLVGLDVQLAGTAVTAPSPTPRTARRSCSTTPGSATSIRPHGGCVHAVDSTVSLITAPASQTAPRTGPAAAPTSPGRPHLTWTLAPRSGRGAAVTGAGGARSWGGRRRAEIGGRARSQGTATRGAASTSLVVGGNQLRGGRADPGTRSWTGTRRQRRRCVRARSQTLPACRDDARRGAQHGRSGAASTASSPTSRSRTA